MTTTTALTKSAVEIPEYLPPENPSWDRARELVQVVRGGVAAIVQLGQELHALKEQWFDQGGDAKISDKTARLPDGRVVSQTGSTHPASNRQTLGFSHDATLFGTRKGWQAKVREELGISHDTADRLIERARYVCMLRDVAEGKAVEYEDSLDEERKVEPTEDMRQLAFDLLQDVVAGTVNAARAWAGVIGEGSRRGAGTVKRAGVDHAKNLKKGLVMLQTSLRHWRRLDPEERADIETLWARVSRMLPDTWTAE